jgi:hypothetical protein
MSDNYTILIPNSPHYVPSESAQSEAVALFKSLAPDADAITAETSEHIQFFDCGENFERILCPDCASEINTTWWQERMNEEAGSGFRLSKRPAVENSGI